MPKLEKGKSLNRAAMERMSTAGLEALLLADFHRLEDGESDMVALYQAAQVLAERELRPNFAIERAWECFQERYLPFVEGSGFGEDGEAPSSDAASGRRHSLSQWWWLAGLAAMAAAVLLSISAAA